MNAIVFGLTLLVSEAALATPALSPQGLSKVPPWQQWRLVRTGAPALDLFSVHTNERRPVVVIIQGSKCYPLFSLREKDGVTKMITPLIFEEVGDKRLPAVHFLAVERRGIKSFGARPAERPVCTDDFGGVTKEDRVRDVADAIVAVSAQPWAANFIVVGHSEGADVASGVAKRLGEKYVSTVALFSGGGPTQFFDFAMEARHRKDDKMLQTVFDDLVWITSDKAEGKYNGYPIKRWVSYALHSSPLDDLRDSAIPVFVAQGSGDIQASVEGSDLLVMELLRNPARKVSYLMMPDVDHDYVDSRHQGHRVDLMLTFLRWALDPHKAREVHVGLPGL